VRQRLRRAGWWIQRLRGKRFIAFIAITAAAALTGWFYGGFDSAATGGIAALVVASLVLAGPLKLLAKRLFVRTAPWRSGLGPLTFAGSDLGFLVEGFVGSEGPRETVDAIAASGGRFASGEMSLELWLVATDDQGQDWTLVQEIREPPAGRLVWTSSVDSQLNIADFDDTGRPNPFRAAHRVVKEEIDVPLVDIELFGWGREQLPVGTRDTVVAFARTSVPAEKLSGFTYPDSRVERSAHLVSLDLDGLAKALGWGHPTHWNGGAAFGILELLEEFQAGAWPALERRVVPRWYEKGMFARVERGTESLAEKAATVQVR